MNQYPRVFADFMNSDRVGRVRLSCAGTVEDLQHLGLQLVPGLRLLLYNEEVEAEGVVEYSEEERRWVARIDWEALNRRHPLSP